MTKIGDRLLGLSLLVLALAYGWGSQQWPAPFGTHETVGPDTFPLLLAVALGITSLYLMVKPDPDNAWPNSRSALELLFAIGVLFAYAALIEVLGFIFTSLVAISLLSWRMGAPIKTTLIIATICSVGVFFIFNDLLSLPLPSGIFEVQ
jgi:putative tricarboxylic transport membrane protein